MNKLAQGLNKTLGDAADFLSREGRRMYFPYGGILGQGGEAKKCSVNATIGMAFEEDGTPLVMKCFSDNTKIPKTGFLYASSFGVPALRGQDVIVDGDAVILADPDAFLIKAAEVPAGFRAPEVGRFLIAVHGQGIVLLQQAAGVVHPAQPDPGAGMAGVSGLAETGDRPVGVLLHDDPFFIVLSQVKEGLGVPGRGKAADGRPGGQRTGVRSLLGDGYFFFLSAVPAGGGKVRGPAAHAGPEIPEFTADGALVAGGFLPAVQADPGVPGLSRFFADGGGAEQEEGNEHREKSFQVNVHHASFKHVVKIQQERDQGRAAKPIFFCTLRRVFWASQAAFSALSLWTFIR